MLPYLLLGVNYLTPNMEHLFFGGIKMLGLCGIENSNRKNKDFWSKNRFNTSFPAALTNYMFLKNYPVNYIQIDKKLNPYISELSVRELYNMGNRQLKDLYFAFESDYPLYKEFSSDEKIDKIDLVIKDINGDYLRPLEIKLTVMPDKTTWNYPESKWGSEIVFRSATTQYCALGMAYNLKKHFKDIRKRFEKTCNAIQSWNHRVDMYNKLPELVKICDKMEADYCAYQQPLVMQPIWKTQGQKPYLSEKHTFDVFVWSDFAFTRLFLGSPIEKGKLTRLNRAAARFARFWYELSRTSIVSLNEIFKDMDFHLQNDKELSATGIVTYPYMKCDCLANPRISSSAIYEIIKGEGEKELKPERRLDQSVFYYTEKNPRSKQK